MPKKQPTRLRLRLLLPVILLVAVGLVLLFLHHRHSSPVIPSSSPLAGNAGPSSTQPSANTAPSDNQNSGTTSTPGATTGPPPLTPYGNFVSNHKPGDNAPTTEASTCNTSAGATCYIEFTNGSIVKKLNAQTTDGKGATIWYWDVKNAGLTAGSWTITAVATLNGQTKTANDSLPLEIQ